MKTFLKIFSGIIVAIIATMIIIPIVLGDRIGEIIKVEANKMVNATVDFVDFDISLFRHFPKASLEMSGFSVTGKEAFDGQTLVAADRIEVVVDLFSIFGDSFEISKVFLNSPEIAGYVTAEGKANWDIMIASEDEATSEVSNEEPSSFKLSITDVRIANAKVSYTDEASRMHFHIYPLDVALRGDLSADETTLTTEAKACDITFISDSTTLAKGLTATLRASVVADLKNNCYTLSDNLLTVNDVKARLNGSVAMEGDDINTDITLDCSDNKFKDILSLVPALYTKDFKSLTADGTLSLTGWIKGRMSGDNYPAYALNLSVDSGSFKYASLPKAVSDIVIRLAVESVGGPLDKTVVNLSRFGASFAGQTFDATAKVSTPLSDPAFTVTAKGKIDLGAVKDIYPLDDTMSLNGIITADVTAAGRMSQVEAQAFDKMQTAGSVAIDNMVVTLSSLPEISIAKASAKVSPKSASLDKLNIKIGNSDISATGSLSNYWGYLLHNTTLSGTLNVASKLIDANELLASLPTDETSAEQPATKDEGNSELLNAIEIPKNLNFVLNSTFDKVLYEKMNIDNIKGKISVKDGVLTLDNLAMKLFEGNVKAYAKYSSADVSSPKVALDASFDKASFKKTFSELDIIKNLAPIFENIDGTYSMVLKADMSLDAHMSPVLESVNGHGQLNSGNLSLGKIKALEVLTTTLNNSALTAIQQTEPTVVSFTIRNGNITTKPFDIKVGKTKLTLSGTTGLNQSIDYDATIALPNNITACAKIGGTFSAPKVKLDTKKTVEKALENAIGIDKGKTNEELQKQADKLIAEAEAAGAKLVATAEAEKQKLVAKTSNKIAKIAAEAAGDKLVAEAKKQSDRLVAEARKKADELLKKGE